MAHRSRKKHIKHAQAHDQQDAAPKAKSPGAKAVSAALAHASSRRVQLTTKAKAAAAAAVKARVAKVSAAKVSAEPAKKDGVVRSIAKAATKKLTAKPRRMISRAKARVRSLLHIGAPDAA